MGVAGVPTCELGIDWEGECGTPLPVLRRCVTLDGAKSLEKFTLCVYPPTVAG